MSVSGKIAVIGLGYVGLPLACLCAKKGFKVAGLELDEEKIELVNSGTSPIKDSYVEENLPKVAGKIFATPDAGQALKDAKIAIVCVPTPAIGDKPDLSFVEQACKTLAPFVSKGELVVIESTVYPGTIAEVLKPILENGSGLKAGKDFFLGHCPERIDPGNKEFSIENIPRVLACLSKEGSKKAKEFYETIVDARIELLSSVESAEAVKVVENTFRDVNIAFVNELAKSFDRMGIDLGEVIKGASTKPFGYMPFYPGPGVGGHCIAQDPYYLIASAKKAGFEHSFLKLAREINNSMPAYVVTLVEEMLKKLGIGLKDAKICLLGLSYKPGIDDTRESPALKIAELLRAKGAELRVFDPFVKGESTAGSLDEAVKDADLVILATHHKQFLEKLTATYFKDQQVKAVVDARNALDGQDIKSKGILYKGIGK
jgi:UDP-N-acetyl-D-glucosamine dehydrogenase